MIKYDAELDKLVDSDNLMTDANMMNLLKDIANKMIKMITWEEDITDSYEDGKLPVLDNKPLRGLWCRAGSCVLCE